MNLVKKIFMSAMILLSTLNTALADTYPNRPVKIVSNLPVGSAPDVFVRKLSQLLEANWKVPVIVENKLGGGGLIALEQYLRTPANGYTIFYGDFGALVTGPILNNKENLVQQLQAITIGYNTIWMIATPANVRNFDELKAKLQETPRFGSWGVGSGGHICGQELSTILQINADHVPYKEFGAWFTDTSNGLLSFGCTSVGSSESYYRSGKLNYVAIASDKRDPAYPNVPTIKELTGQNFNTGEVFSAFFVHSQVDQHIVNKLEKDLRTLIQSQEMVDQVKALRGQPASNTSNEMTKLRNNKAIEYKKLIKKYNISIN